MHNSFPFQCIFSASLPTFQKRVHCTKALHPLTRAVSAVQCVVRFSTLLAGHSVWAPGGALLDITNKSCEHLVAPC